LLGGAFAVLSGGEAHAATTSLCQEQNASVTSGSYIVQNNEYDSSAQECVTTDGNADFTVASSSIANATNGSPGAYPSIYQGCHWGNCSSGGLSSDPIEVSNLTPGTVTTNWSTTQTGSGAYDVAYDIWLVPDRRRVLPCVGHVRSRIVSSQLIWRLRTRSGGTRGGFSFDLAR
jgi:hypothetical protein